MYVSSRTGALDQGFSNWGSRPPRRSRLLRGGHEYIPPSKLIVKCLLNTNLPAFEFGEVQTPSRVLSGVGFGEKKGKDKMCQACGIRYPKRNRGGIFQKSKEEANEEKHEKVNLKTTKQVSSIIIVFTFSSVPSPLSV
ncbi:unnamed protein product [Caretta caretta]